MNIYKVEFEIHSTLDFKNLETVLEKLGDSEPFKDNQVRVLKSRVTSLTHSLDWENYLQQIKEVFKIGGKVEVKIPLDRGLEAWVEYPHCFGEPDWNAYPENCIRMPPSDSKLPTYVRN